MVLGENFNAWFIDAGYIYRYVFYALSGDEAWSAHSFLLLFPKNESVVNLYGKKFSTYDLNFIKIGGIWFFRGAEAPY